MNEISDEESGPGDNAPKGQASDPASTSAGASDPNNVPWLRENESLKRFVESMSVVALPDKVVTQYRDSMSELLKALGPSSLEVNKALGLDSQALKISEAFGDVARKQVANSLPTIKISPARPKSPAKTITQAIVSAELVSPTAAMEELMQQTVTVTERVVEKIEEVRLQQKTQNDAESEGDKKNRSIAVWALIVSIIAAIAAIVALFHP